MNKKIRLLVVAALLLTAGILVLFFLSTRDQREGNFSKLEMGMSVEEVKALLGAPELDVVQDGASRTMYWRRKAGYQAIRFSGKWRVIEWNFLESNNPPTLLDKTVKWLGL